MGAVGEVMNSARSEDVGHLCRSFSTILLLAMLGAVAFAASASAGRGILQIVGATILVIGFFGLAGGLLGFLFAIPRSRQQDTVQAAESAAARPEAGGLRQPVKRLSDYSANTNLEQISDWLTKILLGAGLVQLQEIGSGFRDMATLLAPTLGGDAAGVPLALCLMGFALCWGFFFSYLVTRLWLPKALNRAERDEEIQKLELEKQTELRKVEFASQAELGALERRAYSYLYEQPPSGYSRAIEAIEAYKSRPDSLPSGWLNLYLACAYGQKHADEKPKRGSEEDTRLRDKVAQAVEQATRLSASTKAVLERLYDGSDSGENDLASLNPDESLEKLLRDSKP